MANKGSKIPRKKFDVDRWGFFAPIQLLLSAFPLATTGQRAAILAMALGAVMFVGLGLVGSVTLPAWAVVSMFALGAVLIFATAGMLLLVERRVTAPFRCRQIPVFPPDPVVRTAIKAGLDEIRNDAADYIRTTLPAIQDDKVRANIFLLAQVQGGPADGLWKLVMHDEFAINMNHPPERQLQLSVGQGATGVAFRDGTFQLTRRQPSRKGQWDRKFQMTPELEAQIHKDLKWIVSFPLLKPNTSEAVGVMNIDSLVDVVEDAILYSVASAVRSKVDVIAKTLSLQQSICVGSDQLGVMEHV